MQPRTSNLLFTTIFFFLSVTSTLKAQERHFCGHQIFPSNVSSQIRSQQIAFEKKYRSTVKSPQFQERNTLYALPVVFHIIHNGGVENLSDDQVREGLDHLNDAFANTGYYDENIGEDIQVQFCLAKRDPNDNATTGINHVQSPLTIFNRDVEDVAMKNLSRWTPTSYINIWVVDEICTSNGCSVAGYAYFPSSHGSNVDGIVIEDSYLGSSPASTSVLTHEMGHYLGLYHTFQGGCVNDDCLEDGDRVCDTPPDGSTARIPCSNTANSCSTDVNLSDPNNPFTSDQNDMINNYMDYSNLECYNAFTEGQRDRIHFSIEHMRSSLLDSKACLDPCDNPINASISLSNTTVEVGETFLLNSSASGATTYHWSVNGVTISNSSNASYSFSEEGSYTITLEVNNSDPNCVETVSVVVEVVCPVVAAFVSSGNDVKPGTEVIFSNISQNATSYQWLLNGMPISMNFNFSTTLMAEGTYDIQLVANNGFCSDTSALSVITVSESGIAGTGLPIWPVTAYNSGIIETLNWQDDSPIVEILSDSGDNPTGQTGVAIDACGELAFYAIHTGSSDPNDLNLYLPDGSELLSKNTANSPGFNGVRGNNEIQVVRVPTYSNEWYIIYSEWSTDVGAPLSNAAYNAARILYSRVRLNDKKDLVILERDKQLLVNGNAFTYTSGKAVSRTAHGSKDQHFFYACRRVNQSTTASVDRFLITDSGIFWEKNTGNVSATSWFLSMAGSPIELSPTEDRIAVICRNYNNHRHDVFIFNANTFSASDHISIIGGELQLIKDGTANDQSSVLPYSGNIEDIANDPNLNLRFLRNYDRKLSSIEFSPNGRFLYINTGGYAQSGYTSISYLSQIDLESNPMSVRLQIQTPPDGDYNAISGRGCAISNASCIDAYAQIGSIQSSYDGKLYFSKRHDHKYYVIPNPNDVLPQNLVPGDVNLETSEIPNIDMNGRTAYMPDQIDGHNYTDDRFTKIEFLADALDCNNECLAPYEIQVLLDNKLIETFDAHDCPDTFEFCGDMTKIYSLYAPFIDLKYDSAIVFGEVNYPKNKTFFDFSDRTGCIEICDNNVDDDNDGLVDCDDPELQDSCCCYIAPILELGPDIETCTNGVFELDAGQGFTSYHWSDLSTEQYTTVFEPGKYWVEVVDSCGDIHSDTIQIIWSPISQVDLGDDFSVCDGETVELLVSGFDSYQWSPENVVDCTDCDKINIHPDTTTTYYVVAEKNGCYSVDSITISIGEDSHVSIDTFVCNNETITVGNVELSVGESQIFVLQNSTGCDSTLEISVLDLGFPTFEEHFDTVICANAFVSFQGTLYGAGTHDTIIYQTLLGCDSTFIINVGSFPNHHTTDTVRICYGEQVDIFGQMESISGNYTHVFLSQNACDSTHTTTLLVEDEITTDVTTSPSCHDEDTGSLNISVSGGVQPYSYLWSHTDEATNVLSDLANGEYTVTIVDQLLCALEQTILIESIQSVEIDVIPPDSLCYGHSNGIIDLSNNVEGLIFSLDNQTYTDVVVFDSLPAGEYTIYAQDQHGCIYSAVTEIAAMEEMVVLLPEDTLIQFGEQLEIVSSTNGSGTLIYDWPFFEGLDCNDCPYPIARPFQSQLYTIVLENELGCIASDEIFIEVERKKQIHVPNIFSPNGDQVNDYFLPSIGPGVSSIIRMDIYDRWGGILFQNSNFYPDELSKGWDGTSNGKEVNPGVFVYLIEVEFFDGSREKLLGDLTILR